MTTSWQDIERESIRQRLEDCPILLTHVIALFSIEEMLAEFDKLILDYHADDFSKFATWQVMELDN